MRKLLGKTLYGRGAEAVSSQKCQLIQVFNYLHFGL